MINHLRYLTQKGDPRLQIYLPSDLYTLISQKAKEHKRRLADEFIYLMGFSLKNEAKFDWITMSRVVYEECPTALNKHIQLLPREMLDLLKAAADQREQSLNDEIILRLTATLQQAHLVGLPDLSVQILGHKFKHDEVLAQQIANRNAHLYLYEYEKLKLFLRFKGSIPREIKESFIMIDVKDATKQILAELEKEREQN